MGGSISSENAFSGSVGFKSCLYTISSEELHPINEQNSYNNMEKIVKKRLPIENLEFSTSSSEEEKEACDSDILPEELHPINEQNSYNNMEKIVKERLPIENLEFSTSSSEEEKGACDNDILPDKNHLPVSEGIVSLESNLVLAGIDECSTLMVQPHPFDVDACNDLDKPASELLHLHQSSDEDGEVMEMENTYLKEEKLSSVRTLLTTPSKLLSAIKGSRSQDGNVMNAKMSVKWAPDVYDPPVTSSSHTVKGRHRPHRHSHNHHPKSKKDYYTSSKHSKGKTSRGGSKEKHSHRKTSRHSTSTVPHISRKTIVNTCIEPKIEPLDEEVHSKESIMKYGNSCYIESLASLPLAVAKVS